MYKRSHTAAFLLIVILILPVDKLCAQSKDTVLNMVLSKPYFYNVIQGSNGKVYAGTSDGVVAIEGVALRQYGTLVGYLTSNEKGLPVIDTNGIRYYTEKKFLHLLPYPEMDREEYHAVGGDFFYICTGGRLYIFDLVSYEYSYPNHSFRTISQDLLGTYSGIYLKGKKLGFPAPSFTDGFIRQFGDKAFICNYELMVLEKDALATGILEPGKSFKIFQPGGKQKLISDIFPSPDSLYYYIATENDLIRVDDQYTNDTVLFTHNYKDAPIGLITVDPYSLSFTSGTQLFSLDFASGTILPGVKLNELILDGIYFERQFYLLTGKGIYRFNSGQQLEKLADLDKAHTMQMISGSELVISSDKGLFLFNVVNRMLSIIIKGVEFNRHALYKTSDMIFAGSINGLYKIQIKDIPLLAQNNKAQLLKSTDSNKIGLIIALSVILTLVMLVILFRYQSKLTAAKKTIEVLKTPVETISREKIEDYILNNLSKASIKNLKVEFKMHAPQLYTVLKPDRPGTIIQQLRMQTFKKMRMEGKSVTEIAEATGLSISYLKKLKG